ncbi:MAG: methyl-accepting chemotaxis protein [Tepidisphaeraceae bacterium]
MYVGASTVAIVIAFAVALAVVRSISRQLAAISRQVFDASTQITAGARQVASSGQSLAQVASEQAAALEETSASLSDLTTRTTRNAAAAQEASKASTGSSEATCAGRESMKQFGSTINKIREASETTSQVIRVINEVAFQTNLLALNAAVEAARAGDAGRGFAVVAEEVRNLAIRSSEAATNTQNMIDEAIAQSRQGVAIAERVGALFETIHGGTTKFDAIVTEIASASSEQATGIAHINRAVGEMDKATQQNAAAAEESAAASQQMVSQTEFLHTAANELARMVGTTRKAA